MTYKIGIDVGGTFTDFLLVDDEGKTGVYKTSSITDDPSQSVINGLQLIADDKGQKLDDFLSQVTQIIHGTTITTNAVLTGNLAKTGFLTTKGFRDVLGLRRGLKDRQYDFKYEQPSSIVPRYLVKVASERIDSDGYERLPLNEDDVRQAAKYFKENGVQSVGISFMFSFKDPAHEQRAAEIIQEEMPGVYMSLSSEVLPQIRFYERNSTTALNAATGPILFAYLEKLQTKLQENGFNGILLIMQSNGGVMSPAVAKRFSVNTVLSGPAGGPASAMFYAKPHDIKDLITVDMGGTSFDACLIKDQEALVMTDCEVGGHTIALPVLDIKTIGAGGGSIAWIDSGGILQVGPQSAGAYPGPVCYGRGGTLPTVTDADLVLGYLNPKYFHGGMLDLDYDASHSAIKKHIADPLGLSVIEAANGIYQVINSKMAQALSVASVGKGFDPRDFSLIVAGGAGPIHAISIAKEIGVNSAVVPRSSSVFCAFGMQMCDIKHDYVRTYTSAIDKANIKDISNLLREMIDEGLSVLSQEGTRNEDMHFSCSADFRYIGQFNEVEVPIEYNNELVLSNLHDAILKFHETHDLFYGYSLPQASVEVINLRVSVKGTTKKPTIQKTEKVTTDSSVALKGSRKAYFAGDFYEVNIYDGELLNYGHVVNGPAIIEQETTNIVITRDWDLACDEYNNFILNNLRGGK